jgi:hypothetical protein
LRAIVPQEPNPLYDVAISFLSGDEPLALKLQEQLSESLSVFFYSKKQEQLAGTDGLESFRKAFFSESRLVVVLYRDGWGKTPWTAVEELAIKDRVFSGGWKHLLFVMLDKQSTYPAWLPETHVRLDYSRFANELVGAIRLRALDVGSELKRETALVKAQRMEAMERERADRIQKLSYEARTALPSEWENLCRLLDGKVAEIKTHFTVENGSHVEHDGRSHVIRTSLASLRLCLRPEFARSESKIVVEEYIGRLRLPDEPMPHVFFHGPQRISECTYFFDYDTKFGWCWRSNTELLDTDSLAETLLKQMLYFHEKVESGKVVRREMEGRRSRSQWS